MDVEFAEVVAVVVTEVLEAVVAVEVLDSLDDSPIDAPPPDPPSWCSKRSTTGEHAANPSPNSQTHRVMGRA